MRTARTRGMQISRSSVITSCGVFTRVTNGFRALFRKGRVEADLDAESGPGGCVAQQSNSRWTERLLSYQSRVDAGRLSPEIVTHSVEQWFAAPTAPRPVPPRTPWTTCPRRCRRAE
jgi:hypothetical protein